MYVCMIFRYLRAIRRRHHSQPLSIRWYALDLQVREDHLVHAGFNRAHYTTSDIMFSVLRATKTAGVKVAVQTRTGNCEGPCSRGRIRLVLQMQAQEAPWQPRKPSTRPNTCHAFGCCWCVRDRGQFMWLAERGCKGTPRRRNRKCERVSVGAATPEHMHT
jgi:hypothetical protein